MKTLTILLGVAALICVAACESVQNMPDPEQQPIEYGRYLYEAKCQTCHELYDPREFRQKTLRRYVRKYAARAGLKRDDRPYVVDYLVANARDAEAQ